MALHSAEFRVLDVGEGPGGGGGLEARIQLRMAVGSGVAPSLPSFPDWVRLTVDRSAAWEDAAVTRGRTLREARR